MPKTTYDKDVLLCIFLFLLTLAVWIWIREDWIQQLCVGFGSAVVMGLRAGMNTPDNASTTNLQVTSVESPKE